MYNYVLDLYTEKKGRCAISNILMIEENDNNCFQLSLDAISTRKRHVKGTSRVVCCFVNSINMEKNTKNNHADDPPSMWTPEISSSYLTLDTSSATGSTAASELTEE